MPVSSAKVAVGSTTSACAVSRSSSVDSAITRRPPAQEVVDEQRRGAAVQVVVEDHDHLGLRAGDGGQPLDELAAAEQLEADAVRLGHRQDERRPGRRAAWPASVRSPARRSAAASCAAAWTSSSEPEEQPATTSGAVDGAQSAGPAPRDLGFVVAQLGHGRRLVVDLVRDRQREAHEVVGRRAPRLGGDGVELGGVRRRDPERARLAPLDARDAGVVPAADVVALLHHVGAQVQPGTDGEVEHRRRVGEVLAEDEHGVGAVDVGRRAQPQARVGGDLEDGADEAVVAVGHAEVEVGRADQRAERVVGLERGARRAEADGAAAAQQARRGVQRQFAVQDGGLASGLAARHLRRQAGPRRRLPAGALLRRRLRQRLRRRLHELAPGAASAGGIIAAMPAAACAGSSPGATRAARTRSGALTNSKPKRPRSQRNILLTSRLKRPCTRRSSP